MLKIINIIMCLFELVIYLYFIFQIGLLHNKGNNMRIMTCSFLQKGELYILFLHFKIYLEQKKFNINEFLSMKNKISSQYVMTILSVWYYHLSLILYFLLKFIFTLHFLRFKIIFVLRFSIHIKKVIKTS